MRSVTLLIISLLFAVGCNKNHNISDFSSDGCSLFPDKNLITQEDWCECCFDHDIAYWKGGTREEREKADQKLKECIVVKTDDPGLAKIVYKGVKYGGSPYFYSWYRWGYGWDYGRGYKPLSPAEQNEAEDKLKAYYKTGKDSPCR